jgi:hypothetical protein
METFVVRLWVPGEGMPEDSGAPTVRPGDGAQDRADLRGVVEHAASAASATFVGAEELVGFITGVVAGGRAGGAVRAAWDDG